MTRPQIIRADTIDLQDQNAPSAKDHSRQPTHPSSLGEGPPGPSQAQALKAAGHDGSGIEFHATRSPRMSQDLSSKELSLLSDDASINEIDGTLGSRDGAHGEDSHMGGEDGDDGMDDDMMDKISSSPSIDDGGCLAVPPPGVSREGAFPIISITPTNTPPLIPPPIELSRVFRFMSQRPNSPYVGPSKRPAHPPADSSEVHHRGGYEKNDEVSTEQEDADLYADEERDVLSPLPSERQTEFFRETSASSLEVGADDVEEDVLHGLLLPVDDPLLDNSFDDAPLYDGPESHHSSQSSSSEWENESIGSDDDETPSVSLHDDHHLDDRFIDSGWGGECLREIEDIDFEFVYALHTFAATVEGQANATKGETMVLLDDSNSYWWLVKVVKDSSIGYLPAEHIETPTERLARLNKHRNIDLSQTMLGDNPEKSKNPLKKAMRRRNAKTVQFAPPTYHEAAEIDYSSEEEDEEEPFPQTVAGVQIREPTEQEEAEQITSVEALDVRGQQTDMSNDDIQPTAEPKDPEKEEGLLDEKPRTSEEIFDRHSDELTGKSRRGVVRNTDSFFKDDNVETRKINLTPSLLRDDSSSNISGEPRENKPRGSIDVLEKAAVSPEKKDDKRKDKRSVLGGLFKRRDRKSKQQADPEDNEWLAREISNNNSPQSAKVSSDFSPDSQQASPSQQKPSPSRTGSKLQKKNLQAAKQSAVVNETQQGNFGPRATNGVKSPVPRDETISNTPSAINPQPLSSNANNNSTSRGPPLRVDPTSQRTNSQPTSPSSPTRSQANTFSPIRQVLSSSTTTTTTNPYESQEATTRPERTIPTKQRMPLDDSDDSDVAAKEDPFADRVATRESQESTYSVQSEMAQSAHQPSDRLSESPVQVLSYQQGINNADSSRGTPGLVQDSSSQELAVPTPPSAPSTPELISHPQNNVESLRETPTGSSANGQSPLQLHDGYAQNPLAQSHGPQAGVQNAHGQQSSFAENPSYNQSAYLHHHQQLQQQSQASQQQRRDYSPPLDPSPPSPNHSPPHSLNNQMHTPSPRSHTSSLPLWSDASLRTYLEDDTDIRDLLIVVHDKSDVGKVGKEHPLVRGMYGEERRRVSEMEGRLDGLLKGVLERRGRKER